MNSLFSFRSIFRWSLFACAGALLTFSSRAATISLTGSTANWKITLELAARRPRVLHLVAHGESGRIYFGNVCVDRSALLAHSGQLRQWGIKTINLWSCRVGQDAAFVALLAELTGATVNASTQKIGQTALSATWQLESLDETAASIRAPFDPIALANWRYTLARVYFNIIYQGTGTSYTRNSSSITITAPLSGSSFSFTSANPADVSFSGNNVAGTLSYVASGTVVSKSGVISRRDKSGSNNLSYYFVTTSSDFSTDLGTAAGGTSG